jgi:CRISPR-associated protein Csx3
MLNLRLIPANYQILAIAPDPPDQPIHPQDIAAITLPPDLDWQREIILFGQVPTWVYGALIHQCRTVPWIGCFAALEKQAVVVHSSIPERSPGDRVPIDLKRSPGAAIFIGGPPESGKSVLANALRQSLLRSCRHQVYLHRASWDGEGNWAYEAPEQQQELILQLIREYERRLHEHPDAHQLLQPYFDYHAKATQNLRTLVDLVLVDVGGKVQPEKRPLLAQCTHAILISNSPDRVNEWLDFCRPLGHPLAVIHSVRTSCCEIKQSSPYLEIIAGPWEQGETSMVPELLLNTILQTCFTVNNIVI